MPSNGHSGGPEGCASCNGGCAAGGPFLGDPSGGAGGLGRWGYGDPGASRFYTSFDFLLLFVPPEKQAAVKQAARGSIDSNISFRATHEYARTAHFDHSLMIRWSRQVRNGRRLPYDPTSGRRAGRGAQNPNSPT